jgi:hypothetical protein
MSKALRIPVVLLFVHTSLVLLVWAVVRTSDDSEAVMLWIGFEWIDWPASAGFFPAVNADWPFVVGLIAVGGLQCVVVGSLLQLLVNAAGFGGQAHLKKGKVIFFYNREGKR